ncbi:hypothetical protein PFISCL1PPCAC_27489, partial [Pristionchus fissidentatus]
QQLTQQQPQQQQQQQMQHMQQPVHPSQPSEYPQSSHHYYPNQTQQQFSQGYGDQSYQYSDNSQFSQYNQQSPYYQGQQSSQSFSFPPSPQQPTQPYQHNFHQPPEFAYHNASHMQYPATPVQYPVQYQAQSYPAPQQTSFAPPPIATKRPAAAAGSVAPAAPVSRPRPRRIQPAQHGPAARRSPLLRGEGEETVRQVLQRQYNELRQQQAMGVQMQQAYQTQPLHRVVSSSLPSTPSSLPSPSSRPQQPSQPTHYSGPAPKSSRLHLSSHLTPPSPSLVTPPTPPLNSLSPTTSTEIARQQHVIPSTHNQPSEGGTSSHSVPSSSSIEGCGPSRVHEFIGRKEEEEVDAAAFNRDRATTLMAALERANNIASMNSNGAVEKMTAGALHQAAVVAQNLQSKQQMQQMQQQPAASSSTTRKRGLDPVAATTAPVAQGPRIEVNENGEKEEKLYVLVRHCNQHDEEYNPTGTLKTYDQVKEDRKRDDLFTISFSSHTAPFELADFRIKKPAGFPNVVPPNVVPPKPVP